MVNEILVAVLIASAFFIFALIIQIIGTSLADKRNHKRNMQRLEIQHKNRIDYMKRENFFKKRLEYIEEISKGVESITKDCAELKSLVIFNEIKNGFEIDKKVNLKKIYKSTLSKILKNMKKRKDLQEFLPHGKGVYLIRNESETILNNFIISYASLVLKLTQNKNKLLKENYLKEKIIPLVDYLVGLAAKLIEELKKELI